nr:succinate dehydrogenase [ubiquinone] iron-sulfur subunit 2, mitochondrial [Quercus suber]
MNIDGCNGLVCLTKIESESSASMITPLPHMFVIKDLVVDMTNFYNQYKSIEPWLKRKNPPETKGKEVLQSKKDRAKLDGIWHGRCSWPGLRLERLGHWGGGHRRGWGGFRLRFCGGFQLQFCGGGEKESKAAAIEEDDDREGSGVCIRGNEETEPETPLHTNSKYQLKTDSNSHSLLSFFH